MTSCCSMLALFGIPNRVFEFIGLISTPQVTPRLDFDDCWCPLPPFSIDFRTKFFKTHPIPFESVFDLCFDSCHGLDAAVSRSDYNISSFQPGLASHPGSHFIQELYVPPLLPPSHQEPDSQKGWILKDTRRAGDHYWNHPIIAATKSLCYS